MTPIFEARCPWCGATASRGVAGVISHARACECGAIALGAPPRDMDEVFDDAVNHFGLQVDPIAANFRPASITFGERGIDTSEGGAEQGPHGEIEWVWFKRVAGVSPATTSES